MQMLIATIASAVPQVCTLSLFSSFELDLWEHAANSFWNREAALEVLKRG